MTGAILVVDDQPESLVALRTVLEPLGREVVTAPSGEEALKQLLHEDFSVIVMDVRMPGLDGFQTVELIKRRERHEESHRQQAPACRYVRRRRASRRCSPGPYGHQAG